MSNLKRLASGAGWGTVSVIAITVFQLVFMAVMARLLEPADFGLVAIANVSLRFFSYFAQMGIAPTLIQKPTLEDADVRDGTSTLTDLTTAVKRLGQARVEVKGVLFNGQLMRISSRYGYGYGYGYGYKYGTEKPDAKAGS